MHSIQGQNTAISSKAFESQVWMGHRWEEKTASWVHESVESKHQYIRGWRDNEVPSQRLQSSLDLNSCKYLGQFHQRA